MVVNFLRHSVEASYGSVVEVKVGHFWTKVY